MLNGQRKKRYFVENNDLRCYILEVLERITRFQEYFQIKYKTKDLQDLLTEYMKSDLLDKKAKNLSRKIFNNLARNWSRQLKIKMGMKLEDIIKQEEEEENECEEGEEEEDEGKDKN